MPEDVPVSPEELEQQGFSTRFEPSDSYFASLKSATPPPPKTDDREARRAAAAENTGGDFGGGVTRGLLGAGSSLAGLGEVASSFVPVAGKYAKPFFKDIGDYLSETAAAIPESTPSIKDITNSEDAIDYATSKVGDMVGFLAPTIVLSLLSGGTNLEVAAGKSLASEMSVGISKDLASKLIAGGFIGTEIGGVYRGIRDATGKDAPVTAAILGTASGLLLNSGAMPIVKEFLDGGASQAKKEFLRGYMSDVLNAAVRHGAFLGGASAGSNAIHLLANKFADSTYQLATSQNLIGITDSFLSGIIGGGAVGAAGRALRGPARVREAAPLSREATDFDATRMEAPTSEPSPIDTFFMRDRQARARAEDEARAAADLSMGPRDTGPAVQPNPFSAPPDAGIEAAPAPDPVKAALGEAAANVAKAAEISAAQADEVAESNRPTVDKIIEKPGETAPQVSLKPDVLPSGEKAKSSETAEPEKVEEKPVVVEKKVEPPEPVETKPEVPVDLKPPKPTPEERKAIQEQSANRKKFLKDVGGMLKQIAKMGGGELDVAEKPLVDRLGEWHKKVPDDMLDAGIKQVAEALAARRKESNPDIDGLLVDAKGKPVTGNYFFDSGKGNVLIRVDRQTAYVSKKKFSSMKEFEKERDALLSDSSNWVRQKNGGVWLFHDAPFTTTEAAGNKELWSANLIYHLRRVNKTVADAVEAALSSDAITPGHLLGLIGANERIEGGKAKRSYPNRLTPAKAAELLPDAIKRAIEREHEASRVQNLSPEEVADLSEEEITAMGSKTERMKFLERAREFDPESLKQWLESGEERRVSEPLPTDKEIADTDEVDEDEDEKSTEVKTKKKGGGGGGGGESGGGLSEKIVKYADGVAALFAASDEGLGTVAGDMVYRVATDGGVDKVTFVAQMTDLLSKVKSTAAKAAQIAELIYEDADKMREAGAFRGRLADGVDFKPQTSSEHPIAHASAVGAEAIAQLVNDPRFGFSEEMRRFTNRFLAQVDPMYLDGLTLMAVSKIEVNGKSLINWEGSFEPLLRIAKVAMNSRNPDVIAHEISHNLYFYLPEAMRDRVDADWRKAVEAQILRETDPAAVEMLRTSLKLGGIRHPILGRIADKGAVIEVAGPDGKSYKVRFDGHWDLTEYGKGMMPQFTAMEDIPGVTVRGSSHMLASLEAKGVKFPVDVLGKIEGWDQIDSGGDVGTLTPFNRLYHLVNPHEYFVSKLLKKTGEAEVSGVWGHVREFVSQIIGAIKSAFGIQGDNLWDAIAEGFRNGSFEKRYLVWAKEAEASGSVSRKKSEFEKNIRRSPTASQRLLEATSALAQNLTLSRVAERIATELNATPRARRLAGLTDDMQVAEAAKDYTDPRTYMENRVRLGSDTPQWLTIADDTFKKYRGRELKLQNLRSAEANQRAYLESEAFRKKLGRKSDLETRINELKEQQHETLKTTLAETIKANQKILAQENLEEGRASQLRNEIAAIEAIVKNKVGGLEQLINHIINVVSLSPDGRGLLFGATDVKGAEILKAYESVTGRVDSGMPGDLKIEVPYGDLELSDKEIRRLEHQANQLRRPSQALYSIAADVIARQLELSQSLAASELIRNNPALYNEYADQFSEANLKLLTTNPQAFAAKFSKSLISAGKKEGVIGAALATINRHMASKVNQLVDTIHGAAIVEATLKNPEVAATYKQAALDSKQVATSPVWAMKALKADTLVQKRTFVLPDKSKIAVDFSVNEKVPAEYDKAREAASKIYDYMATDEGQADPYLPYWQEQYRALYSIYASDLFLGIIKTHDPVTFGFGEIRLTVPRIQTRQGNLATIDATNWDHAVKAFGHWMLDHAERDIKLPLFEAAKSHPELGKFSSASEAVIAWRKAIGTELTGRPNAIGEGWSVGDQIGKDHTVTAEDLALLRSMLKAIDAAYNLTPQKGRTHLMVKQYVEDAIGTLREPLKKNPWLLPANFSRDMVKFSRLAKSITEGNPIESLPAEKLAELRNLYDQYFHEAVKPFLDDTEVLVDGGSTNFPIEAYRAAYNRIRNGEITDFGGLVRHFTSYAIGDEIHSDWVEKRLAEELTKQSDFIYESTQGGNVENRFMPLDSYNSFTLARGRRVANYGFYEYGLFDDVAIRSFADDGSSFYFDRFRKSLDAAREDLSQTVSKMEARHKDGMDGDTYKEFQALKAKLRDVGNLIHSLDEAEGKFGRYQSLDIKGGRRAMNTLVTAAIANPVTGLGDLSGNWIRTVEYMSTMFGRRALSPGWNLAFAKAIGRGAILALKGTVGGAVAGVRGFGKPGPLQERAARALESAVEAFSDAPFLKEMAKAQGDHARFLREMAAMEYYHKVDPVKVGNRWRAPATGGAIYDIKGDPKTITRKVARVFNRSLSAVGALVDATADTLYRQFNITGDLGIASVSHLALESIRLQLARTFENLGEAGLRRQFNLADPKDPKNVVHASMILRDGSTNSNLSHFAELTKLAGFSHNEMAVDYWRRLAAADPARRNEVELLKPEQASMFARKMIEDINQPTISNRALVLKKTAWGRLFYPLMGWSWNAAGQSLHWFSRAVSDPQRSTTQLRYMQLATVAGLVAFAGASAIANEEVMRKFYRWFLGEVKPGRQPWEAGTDLGALKRVIIAMSSILPVINIVPNIMFNDVPGSAAQGVDVFLQNKVKDLLGYFSGVIASKDPWYGFPDLLRRTFPITRAVVNMIPAYSGTVEIRNASRLLQRYAPDEIRRPAGGPIGATTATELTPYGRRMANAAMHGDIAGLKEIYAEAVAKAREMGRPDPERVVQQLYESQNPVRSALKAAPSPEQWADMLGKMSDGDREDFQDTLEKFQSGGEAIGVRVAFQRGGGVVVSAGQSPAQGESHPISGTPAGRSSISEPPSLPPRRTSGSARYGRGSYGPPQSGSLRGTSQQYAQPVVAGGGRGPVRGGVIAAAPRALRPRRSGPRLGAGRRSPGIRRGGGGVASSRRGFRRLRVGRVRALRV